MRNSVKVFDGPQASRNAGAARQKKRSRVSSMGEIDDSWDGNWHLYLRTIAEQ